VACEAAYNNVRHRSVLLSVSCVSGLGRPRLWYTVYISLSIGVCISSVGLTDMHQCVVRYREKFRLYLKCVMVSDWLGELLWKTLITCQTSINQSINHLFQTKPLQFQ